jgi:hypothetical protein
MMQTNGPVRDYARYANASSNPLLRPQSPQETNETAVSIFRRYFSRILPLTLIPSLYVSGFAVILIQMILPRLFETENVDNIRSQVVEFTVVLLVGCVAGTIAYALGTSQIAVIANEVVKAEMAGQDLTTSELERRCKARFSKTFITTLRISWHHSGLLMLGVLPLITAGFLLGITSTENQIPAYLVYLSGLMIIIGLIITLMRVGTTMIAVSIAAEEQISSGAAIKRSKSLQQVKFGRSGTDPVVNAAILVFLIYLLLVGSLAILNSMLKISSTIIEWFSNSLVKGFIDILLGLFPHMLVIVFVVPYLAICSSFNYYQRRIRLEGMDIEALFSKLPANQR